MGIVLASASPRRSKILKMLGLSFEICPSNAEEIMPAGLSPQDTVMSLALQKSKGVDGDVVISADTIVYLDGEIFGKPKDKSHAFEMLKRLSGNTHQVYTGICINGICDFEKTDVTFAVISEEEISRYLETDEPMDKAGAYAVQGIGAKFIEKIDGDFFNVMGLPVHKMYQMFKSLGMEFI